MSKAQNNGMDRSTGTLLQRTLYRSFGTIESNGDIRLNLIIRSMIATDSRCFVQAGGGIVIDSTPEYEYNENRIKTLCFAGSASMILLVDHQDSSPGTWNINCHFWMRF